MRKSTTMLNLMTYFTVIVLFGLALLPGGVSAHPHDAAGTAHITGWVVDDTTGQALQGVKVAVTGAAGYETTTDGWGNFAFRGLPAGEYRLNANKDGYQSYRSSLISLLDGMTVDVEIRLKASAGFAPAPTSTQRPVPTLTPTPATKWEWIAGASEQFSTIQGKDHWYYLVHDFSGYHEMPWDPEDKWWQWGYPHETKMDYVKQLLDGGHPGPNVDSLRAWQSPLRGTIRIVGRVHKYPEVDVHGSCPYIWWTGCLGGDGVTAYIKKNEQVLWKKYISGFDDVGYPYEVITHVEPGDRIYFGLNMNKTPEYDGTFFDPGIYATSDAVFTAPAGAPKQPSGSPGSSGGTFYTGEVEGYLDYPGMGIEVHVRDANGQNVVGAKVHTHAFSVDFWDGTGSDGAFRRDGFTHDCVWEVTLESEPPVMLPVKFEANKLVVVNFTGGPCR